MAEATGGCLVVLVSAPDLEAAGRMARLLVDQRLAACCNLLEGVRSVYRWEGKVCDEKEVLMVIKTRRDAFAALKDAVAAAHPYSVPEIIALPVVDGHAPYLSWVDGEVRRQEAGGEV